MHPDWRRICDEFLVATSYSPEEMETAWADRTYDRENRPETYLTYPEALERVELGTPDFPIDSPSVWQTIADRRSKRNFLKEPMTLNALNVLLWSTQGITADMGDYQLRAVPSAGALYPIETYLFINNVEGVKPGVYHLDVKGWTLEAIRLGDVAELGCHAILGQSMCREASVNFVWTAVLDRCLAKYYERAYRYVWWDVGHISQNLAIAATALGLGVCSIGAWHDSVVHDILGIDGKTHFSALCATVGTIEGSDWLADRRFKPSS